MSGAGADWLPDPTGRHQLRYWDGTQWTAWVADAGVQSEDPLASEAPGDREAVLQHSRLRVERLGGRPVAGWRAVRTDSGADVGRVWRDGPVARLCDAAGGTVLTVTASGTGLAVDDADGPLAAVSYASARSTTLKCTKDGARLLTVKFRQSLRGKLGEISILDGDERQVGTIEEVDWQAKGSRVSSWLVLDRDPALVDPVRALAVAAPVMIDCFVASHGSAGGDGPDMGMDFGD